MPVFVYIRLYPRNLLLLPVLSLLFFLPLPAWDTPLDQVRIHVLGFWAYKFIDPSPPTLALEDLPVTSRLNCIRLSLEPPLNSSLEFKNKRRRKGAPRLAVALACVVTASRSLYIWRVRLVRRYGEPCNTRMANPRLDDLGRWYSIYKV